MRPSSSTATMISSLLSKDGIKDWAPTLLYCIPVHKTLKNFMEEEELMMDIPLMGQF